MPKKSHKTKVEEPVKKKKTDVVKLESQASPNIVLNQYEMFMGQLLEATPPVMSSRFYEMYLDAWEYVDRDPKFNTLDAEEKQTKTLGGFQQLLGQIPKWEEDRITEEATVFIEDLPWMRETLRQMLIARVSILVSCRSDRRTQGDFEFVMPDNERIVHTFFMRAARKIRGKAYLYNHEVDEIQREDNALLAEDIIRDSLTASIHSLVPLGEVVQSHLIEANDDEVPVDGVAGDDKLDVSSGESYDEDEDEYGYGYEEEEESYSSSVHDETLPADEPDYGDEDAREKKPVSVPVLDPADVPEDKSAATETVVEGDTKKEVKLKEKARELRELLDDLKRQRSRINPRQKEHLAALDEEIEYRQGQLKRTKSKLKGTEVLHAK
jgi:hypothetical protein